MSFFSRLSATLIGTPTPVTKAAPSKAGAKAAPSSSANAALPSSGETSSTGVSAAAIATASSLAQPSSTMAIKIQKPKAKAAAKTNAGSAPKLSSVPTNRPKKTNNDTTRVERKRAPSHPTDTRSYKQAEAIFDDFESVTKLLVQHDYAVKAEVDTFVNLFEFWGRRDVSAELPRVNAASIAVSDGLSRLRDTNDQHVKDLNVQLKEILEFSKSQVRKSAAIQERRHHQERESMERLQTYRRTLAEDLVTERERLAGDHIRRMSSLVNQYVPAASGVPSSLIANQAPSIARSTSSSNSNKSSSIAAPVASRGNKNNKTSATSSSYGMMAAAATAGASPATVTNASMASVKPLAASSSSSSTVGHFTMQAVPPALAAAVAALEEQEANAATTTPTATPVTPSTSSSTPAADTPSST